MIGAAVGYLLVGGAVAGAVGMMGGAFRVAEWLGKRKNREWSALARQYGFAYQESDPELLTRHGDFPLFLSGRYRQVWNALLGRHQGFEFEVATYGYYGVGGSSSVEYYRTVCVVPMEGLVPCEVLRQGRVDHLLPRRVRGADFDFDDDEEFSRSFVLRGADEGAVRRFFDAELRSQFNRFAGTELAFQALPGAFLIHHGRAMAPSEAFHLMHQATELAEAIRDRLQRGGGAEEPAPAAASGDTGASEDAS